MYEDQLSSEGPLTVGFQFGFLLGFFGALLAGFYHVLSGGGVSVVGLIAWFFLSSMAGIFAGYIGTIFAFPFQVIFGNFKVPPPTAQVNRDRPRRPLRPDQRPIENRRK
jgi:hypothetical protein